MTDKPERALHFDRSNAPHEAVRLLKKRFPSIGEILGDDPSLTDPFYAYERFGEEVRRRVHDQDFRRRVGDFINELQQSGDPLLQEVLVISLLENIAQDSNATVKIKEYVNSAVVSLLQDVETRIYGRSGKGG